MNCARCGTDNPSGSVVCSACGARLTPPQPGSPGTRPTQVPRPQSTQPPAGPVRKKRPVWLIVAVVAGGLFLLAAICGIVALLLFVPTTSETKDDAGATATETKSERAGDGYSSPEKALDAEAKNLISGDWVFYTVDEQDDYVEYWVGPQNEEFEKGVIVTKTDKGKWVASDVYTLDLSQQTSAEDAEATDDSAGDATAEGDPTDEEIAVYVVSEYLTAVGEGRGDDAFDMTMPPLSESGPDSMIGDFETFEISGSELEQDGSIVVFFVLSWSETTSDMGAVIQTDADGILLISDVYELAAE